MATLVDVAVVGAGPAGAMAAYEAAMAGRRVLLLERAELPRYKTCGGGLTAVSLAALPEGVMVPVAAAPDTAEFTVNGRRRVRRSVRGPLLRMVNRSEFDAELVRVAQEAGARLMEKALVRKVTVERAWTALTLADGRVVEAGVVVGADGTGGIVRQAVAPAFDQVDVGLEVEVRTPEDQRDRWARTLLIDWGPLPGSYGWVFPKGDTLTVGVIGDRTSGAALRTYLARFVQQLGLDTAEVVVDSGHLTRVRSADSPVTAGNILLAGDAAGLLEPWTREGISFALRSGRLAGRHAAAGTPEAYATELAATLGAEARAGRVFLDAFARRPLLFHAIMATPPGWAVFRRVVAGQTTFARLSEREWIPKLAAKL